MSRNATAFALALVTGCAGTVTLEELPDRFASALCAKTYECCTAEEVTPYFEGNSLNPIASEPSCVRYWQSRFEYAMDAYKAAIAAGELIYSETAARECITQIEERSCAEFARDRDDRLVDDLTSNYCDSPFTGTTPTGGSCTFHVTCVGGSCIDGICHDKSVASDPCGVRLGLCAEGLWCSPVGGPQASTGTCRPLRRDGESCSYGGEYCESGGCTGGSTGVCGTPTICNGSL